VSQNATVPHTTSQPSGAQPTGTKEGQNGEAENETSREFFSGTVGSLLNATATVRQIEIRRRAGGDRLHEEIDLSFR